MEPSERLRAWTYRRQLLGEARGGHPLGTLEAIVGVYSTHPTAPLALLARDTTLQPGDLGALEQRREVVRIPAMRGSGFLLPTSTAPSVFAATRLPAEKLVQRLRGVGLDEAVYRRLSPLALECAATPVTPTQLRTCAQTDEDVYLVLRMLAREGQVLRLGGSLRADQLKYVATEAWLGKPLDDVDPEQALSWLAGEYLRAFGPARVADFAWWSGARRRAAAAALHTIPTVDLGNEYLVREADEQELSKVEPLDPEAVDVLPKWDSYTMAYAPDGRERLIDDQYLSRCYTSVVGSPGATAGDGLPLILKGGRVVASWSHRFAGTRLHITVTPFEGEHLPDSAFDAIGQLLSASTVVRSAVSKLPCQDSDVDD